MMLFLLIACMPKEGVYIARTKISIQDELPNSKSIAIEAREALEFSNTDWWEPLPILRWFSSFEESTPMKLGADVEQVRLWFVEQGWRDVTVGAEQLPFQGRRIYRPPRDREAVLIEYQVHLGDRWIVESVEIQGLEGTPIKIDSIPTKSVYWKTSLQQEIAGEITSKMGALGYADTEVIWRATPLGDHRVSLEGSVELNQLYHFGRIEYQDIRGEEIEIGTRFFPEQHLQGQPYNERRLQRIIYRLEQVASYEQVEVTPIIQRERQQVDLLIRVLPADRWDVQPVINVASEATTYAIQGGLDWKHRSGKGKGLSFEAHHDIGYRNFPQFNIQFSNPVNSWFDVQYHGFSSEHNITLSKDIFPLGGTSLMFSGLGGVTAEFGYQEASGGAEVGFHWASQRWMTIETSIGYSAYSYFPMLEQNELYDKWFDEEGLAKEVLQPEWKVNIGIQEPNVGFVKLESVPYGLSNGKSFSRLYLQSGVQKVTDDWSVHSQLRGGLLHWWDGRELALTNQFFLGGVNAVRGWGYRRLNAPLYRGTHLDVQPGGEVMLMSSLEVRYQMVPEYYIFTFVDAGRVWFGMRDQYTRDGNLKYSGVHLNQILPSVGGGVMAPTFLGSTALSGAWQLVEDNELSHPPPRFSFHLSTSRPF